MTDKYFNIDIKWDNLRNDVMKKKKRAIPDGNNCCVCIKNQYSCYLQEKQK